MFVLWDIDGVLVDSEPLHRKKIEKVALKCGFEIKEHHWQELHGIGDRRIWQWLAERTPMQTLAQFEQDCLNEYLAHADELSPREGAQEIIRIFADNDIPQGVVTSGVTEQVEANLACLEDACVHLKSFITADNVSHTKPHPEPYIVGRMALSHALIEQAYQKGEIDNAPLLAPKDGIAIEDSSSGVESAKAAGLKAIHWLLSPTDTPNPKADYVARDLNGLREIVAQLCLKEKTPAPKVTKKFGQYRP